MNLHATASKSLPAHARARRVTAVLGPTNTGKTHLAIERMLGHASGVIGLPLRLLAREVYNRMVEKAGADKVALVTGEEKIKPANPRYWVATVEAMPRDLDVDFVAVDEIQLACDYDRGHVFTDRLLNRRGREETMLIGADTMRPSVERLLPGVRVVSRPRLSTLTFAGERKLSRLPRRSGIVAFSAEEVYAIAEWIRRQRGGAAVVLGALSPRTRNAQVAMFQAGEVDYIVATDAIGMGLNLDVDHIAFAGDRKFDGWQYRRLNPAEFGQIAGRAGRHLRDGTFGTTGRCPAMDLELAEAVENHRFDSIPVLQWRNSDLDFSTIPALQRALDAEPREPGLTRAPLAEDVLVLDILSRNEMVRRNAKTAADIGRLWDACQIPDYRKVSPSAHAELVETLFGFIVRAGQVPDDWFSRQLSSLDRIDGDIDTLSARIAQVRTFNYIANRPDWMNDPEHWQNVTRQVEDNLSDALHERLAHRFVDRRTSVLMRRLRENAMLEAEITGAGDVMVEGQHVGVLHGFRFTADPKAEGEAQRTLNAAAQKALAAEIEGRARRVGDAVDDAFVLTHDGTIRWLGEAIAKLSPGERLLKPLARVIADEQLTGAALENVNRRLDLWIDQHIRKLLGPLMALESGEGLEGLARGVAFQVSESLGVLDRARIADDLRALDQASRACLRKLGVRFGAYNVYMPQLLKPAPRALAAQLWMLKHDDSNSPDVLEEVSQLAASGRTSFGVNTAITPDLYHAAGFRVCGARAVRVDILERLADLIRPAVAYRPGQSIGEPPPGAADRDGFVVTVAMTSLAGCSGEDFASILQALGYVAEKRAGPAITVPIIQAAPTVPIGAPAQAEPASDAVAAEARSGADGEGREPGDTPAHAPEPDDADEAASAREEQAASMAETPPTDAETPMTGFEAPTASAEAAPATEQPAPSDATAGVSLTGTEAPAEAGMEPPADAATVALAQDPDPEASGQEQDAPEPEPVLQDQTGPEAGEHDTAEPEVPGQGDAGQDSEAPQATEPELIEIWRPRRHHGGRRDARPPRRGRRPSGEDAQGHPHRRPAPTASAASETPASEGASDGGGQGQKRSGRERFPQRQGGNHKAGGQQGSGGRGPAAQGGGEDGRNRGEGQNQRNAGARQRRGDRGQDRNQDRNFGRRPDVGRPNRQFATTEPGRGRNREPDPDSPFAKLLALKQQLENKDGKD